MRLADTMLTWAARISLILAAWAFLAFLTATAWHLTRQAARRRSRQQAVREVGEDTLDMLAARYAQDPGGHERLTPAECPDCTWRYGGQPVWWPCVAHLPETWQHIHAWERELEDTQ